MIYSKFHRYIVIYLVFFITTCLSLTSHAQDASQTRILVLGDSLSAGYGLKQEQGWVHLLQLAYDKDNQPIKLINASISGETTGGALRRLDDILNKQKPDFVLIELGGNDGLRGFPIKSLKNNLLQLTQKITQFGATPGIMSIQIPPNYGQRYNTLFNQTFTQVAEQTKSKLFPFFMTEIALDKSLMQSDDLHPNKKAQPLIRDIMAKQLINWLKQQK